MATRNIPSRDVLPDVVGPDLKVLICGSAVGAASARAGAYYAHPGNRFWRTLHDIGLTPHRVAPPQYRDVLRYGIGMTDLCKSQSGADATLDPSADDPARVMRLVRRWRPKSLAFNGKRAAAVFFGARVAYGRQPAPIDETAVFVLPSTAGLAGGAWDIGYWRALAAFLAAISRSNHRP